MPDSVLHLKRLWFAIGYLLLLLVAIGSLMPAGPDLGGSDKAAHLFSYAVLSAWFSLIVQSKNSLWWVFLGLTGYGVLIEYVQGLTGYRYADVADALANSIGVVAGILCYFSPLRSLLHLIDARLSR